MVDGHDIVSWGAVDSSRPDGQSDELIGFVTARIVLAKESDVILYSLLVTVWLWLDYLVSLLSLTVGEWPTKLSS